MTNRTPICFYHSKDLDGLCSGAIVKIAVPDAEMVGYDYGEPFKIERCKDRLVIMVDVSLPIDKMEELAIISADFTWIDHHKSAIQDFKDSPLRNDKQRMKVELDINFAACELTWMHFYPRTMIPELVSLIGTYDIYRDSHLTYWNEVVLPFQFGARERFNSVYDFISQREVQSFLVQDKIAETVDTGKAILSYQKKQNARYCKAAFEFSFEGIEVICLNTQGGNSLTFEGVYDHHKHQAMMPFFFDGEMWKYGLYTTHNDIDCAAICKRYGGGGHQKAAGFKSKVNLLTL